MLNTFKTNIYLLRYFAYCTETHAIIEELMLTVSADRANVSINTRSQTRKIPLSTVNMGKTQELSTQTRQAVVDLDKWDITIQK